MYLFLGFVSLVDNMHYMEFFMQLKRKYSRNGQVYFLHFLVAFHALEI
jgi:hypothetical protein